MTQLKTEEHHDLHHRLTAAGLLITLGVVYGDIGTSPLYVMKSLVAENGGMSTMTHDFLVGSVSLVFWTLAIVTTLKYVIIALHADNKGEGGIFALFTLVRQRAKWLLVPAVIGGAALLADGMLTPAVTVTTAIEGLKNTAINNHVFITQQDQVIITTVIIISVLFFIQRFGTQSIGRLFGPIMTLWFLFLGVLGFMSLTQDWSMLAAINPYYAVKLLFSPANKVGILILGSIFLATTGAEALYSDMGHVGRPNIYGSWPFVNICLVLNYLGQAVWIDQNRTNAAWQHASDLNPFFDMMPASIHLVGIILATLAAIIASQALISGSYTLVAEAIRLRFLPRLRIVYPSKFKGQLYIPSVNMLMWITCIAIVLYFRTSAHMEAAYGLAITVTMLMTTILLYQFLRLRHTPRLWAWVIFLFFASIETVFFIASAAKFMHGGYVTVLIAMVILLVMFIWLYGGILRDRNSYTNQRVSLLAYKNMLNSLHTDSNYERYADNLVYLTKIHDGRFVKKNLIYSIVDKRPKRADVYWFVTVNVTDEPYTAEYTADTYGTNYMVNVQLFLGFRMQQTVNVFLRQVVQDLMATGEIDRQPQKYTTMPGREVGDWSFVLVREELSSETRINSFAKIIIQSRLLLQRITVSPARWFGLEYADVVEEHVPLILGKVRAARLKRVHTNPSAQEENQ